ncbi:phage tail protein [Clostridium botulinum]|uniref:phage tail protein n=2 Tax=Clostridium botulinum TaxID=1491 RepID=UPI001F1A2731|nr:phage tail protein [Clostridium botulinum]
MAEKFYTILTKVGKAKIANATALGNKVNFTTLKVGDGGGKYYNPTEEQEDLVNEVWQGNINSIRVDENNPNWVVIEVIIPSSVGGFMIREAGVFDDENNMLAIGKYPETYKPQAQDGSTKDLVIRTNLEISNTSSVTLKVDPTVILATQKDIQILENKIKNIKIPVTKVNEKTGDVVLTASDIKTENGQTVEVQLADITTLTGNKDNLKTTNKTNLVSAINEVFTSGNNVKINTVDALLQLDKSLQITKESKWEDIIKNISKISTGKKWAQGTANVNYYGPEVGIFMESNYPLSSASVNTNCGFKPSIVILTTIGITPRKNPDDYFRSDDRYSEPRIELYIYNELLQVKITFKTKSGYSSDIAYDREYSIEKINSIGNTIYTSLHIMRYSVRVEKGTSTAERYMFDKVNWYAYE